MNLYSFTLGHIIGNAISAVVLNEKHDKRNELSPSLTSLFSNSTSRVYRSQGGEKVCGAVSCPTDVCHIDKPPKQKVISENNETNCLHLSEFSLFLDASANSNLPFLVGFRHQYRRRFPR